MTSKEKLRIICDYDMLNWVGVCKYCQISYGTFRNARSKNFENMSEEKCQDILFGVHQICSLFSDAITML